MVEKDRLTLSVWFVEIRDGGTTRPLYVLDCTPGVHSGPGGNQAGNAGYSGAGAATRRCTEVGAGERYFGLHGKAPTEKLAATLASLVQKDGFTLQMLVGESGGVPCRCKLLRRGLCVKSEVPLSGAHLCATPRGSSGAAVASIPSLLSPGPPRTPDVHYCGRNAPVGVARCAWFRRLVVRSTGQRKSIAGRFSSQCSRCCRKSTFPCVHKPTPNMMMCH